MRKNALLSVALSLFLLGVDPLQAEEEKFQITTPAVELKTEKETPKPPILQPTLPSEKIAPGDIKITPLPPEEVAYQPTVLKEGMAVEIILDTSGSMNGILGGDSKHNLAIALLQELSTQWRTLKEPPIQFALRVFGSDHALEENNCEDSHLLTPLGVLDPLQWHKELKDLKARGQSSLAFALKQALAELKNFPEDRVILLVADGGDSCNQSACAIAKELYNTDKIIIHVIGFDIPQTDEAELKCIAESSKGVFLLARTKEELLSSLDEALRSTIPYNLRLKVMVGGTPIKSTITLLKAGTQTVLQKEESYGIELLRLPAGSYDILVEYSGSKVTQKPSKLLKGVELTATGKVEQEIRFDLASLTLSAFDAAGKAVPTQFTLHTAGTQTKIAEWTSEGEEETLFVAPGSYDLTALKKEPPGQEMTLEEPNIQVSLEQGFIKRFAFQTGTIILKSATSDKKPIAVSYSVTKATLPDSMIAKGKLEATGGKIELPPGTYDIYIEGEDPTYKVQPRGELKNVAVEGGSIQEQTIVLKIGQIHLKALKAENEKAPSEFKIINQDQREVASVVSKEGEVTLALSPGTYDVQAHLLSTIYTKPPIAEVKEVKIEEGKTLEQRVVYELGALKLLGRNAKEQRINTKFTIFEGGTEEVVAQIGPTRDWVQFDLPKGNYDLKAIDVNAQGELGSFVWQRDITIEANALYVREAVFTNAKLRLIGRGTNNQIVPVRFKIYEYGHDRPLISGATGQDWQSFDLVPGNYYVEASYIDQESSQILKKWITLQISENEFVEKELRF